MPHIHEPAQRPHELRNIVKMQACGGLVKQEQRAFVGQALFRLAGAFGRCG